MSDGGVIVVPCPNRAPPAKGTRGLRIARRYHFLCPDDHAVLLVIGVAGSPSTRLGERRLRFGLCPTCGFKWWGPRIADLPTDRSLLPTFGVDQTAVEKEEQLAEKFGIGGGPDG